MEAAWVPTTDDRNEEAEMSEDGDGVCHWKHVVWLRALKPSTVQHSASLSCDGKTRRYSSC